MGTSMMMDVAQKATRPFTEDSLVGVSLLLPAPQCCSEPLWGLQPTPQQRAGARGAPGAERDPQRVQHGRVAHLQEAAGLLAPSPADEGHWCRWDSTVPKNPTATAPRHRLCWTSTSFHSSVAPPSPAPSPGTPSPPLPPAPSSLAVCTRPRGRRVSLRANARACTAFFFEKKIFFFFFPPPVLGILVARDKSKKQQSCSESEKGR